MCQPLVAIFLVFLGLGMGGHTLNRRRRQFNDLDGGVPELVTEAEGECVQGGLGRRVGGEAGCRNNGEVGTGAG